VSGAVSVTSREACLALDAQDPLAPLRAQFTLPDGVIYLDGNSLGALPRATAARVADAVERQWGEGLIRSWNDAGWVDLPARVGARIGQLLGAGPGEVVAADSTSINLFKVLAAALRIQAERAPERRVIVSERGNFPTDLYIAQGLADLLGPGAAGPYELRLIDAPEQLASAVDERTAVVLLTQVDYRTGTLHDMRATSALAHDRGALIIWDLAHSAGAVPLDLPGDGADFAIGCGYKYLNGGPGAPAFVWVAPRHQEAFWQPLSGWFGHAAPFAFEPGYRPAPGIARYLCGTPPVLSMIALDSGLDTLLAAGPLGGMPALRAKSIALTGAFIDLVEERCAGLGLSLVSPRDGARRGSQASLAAGPDLAHGYPVMQALIARGVIGDFRAPDVLRFGFTPLYTRFVDVWDAVETLRDILATRSWDTPRFHRRAAVT
jgi:kynureninase